MEDYKIDLIIQKRTYDEEEYKIKMRMDEEFYASEMKKKRKYIIENYCKPCTLEEYVKWVIGYLKKGKRISNFYDYNFPSDTFFILKKSFELKYDFYGSDSFVLIIPENVCFRRNFKNENGNDVYYGGHCNFLYEKDYFVFGSVDMYRDVYNKIVGDSC